MNDLPNFSAALPGENSPKHHKIRPLSWFSLTNFPSFYHSAGNTDAQLYHNNSYSVTARNTFSSPDFQGFSTSKKAQSEELNREHFHNLSREMTKKSIASTGQQVERSGLSGWISVRKERFKNGKDALSRAKSAFLDKLKGAGPKREQSAKNDDFIRLRDEAGSAAGRAVQPGHQLPSETLNDEATVGAETRTDRKGRHQRNRLSQSSIARQQLLNSQPAKGHNKEAESDHLSQANTTDTNTRNAHPELVFGEIRSSIFNAIERLTAANSSEETVGPKEQSDTTLHKSPQNTSTGLDDGKNGSKQKRFTTAAAAPAPPQSVQTSTKASGDDDSSNLRQEHFLRVYHKLNENDGRQPTTHRSGHPDGLRSHPNVMQFAEPPKSNNVEYSMSEERVSRTLPSGICNSSNVMQSASSSQPANAARPETWSTTTPRIEITKDEDQMSELDDAPIFSESMNNLSQYGRTTQSSGQSPSLRLYPSAASPRDSLRPVETSTQHPYPQDYGVDTEQLIMQGNAARQSRSRSWLHRGSITSRLAASNPTRVAGQRQAVYGVEENEQGTQPE